MPFVVFRVCWYTVSCLRWTVSDGFYRLRVRGDKTGLRCSKWGNYLFIFFLCMCVFQSLFDVLYIVWSRNQSQLFSIQIVLLLQLVWKSVCERLPEFHWSLCHKSNDSLGKTWCLNYCGLSSDFCFASVFILFVYIFMYFLELSWTCFHRCLCAPTKHTCHTVSWDFDLYFIYPFREELASL